MQIKDFIKKYDSKNQFKVLQETHKQISDAWKNPVDVTNLKSTKFSHIIFCGLGGSAISGDLLCDYLSDELKIPFNVIRGYNLPSYTDSETLIIISSYSGNTEEIIHCIEQAMKKKSSIVVITSGGKVSEIASVNNLAVIKLQGGFQPRFALGSSFFSLLKLIQELGFADEEKNVKQLIELFKVKGEEFSGENNHAIQIAEQVTGFVPVIYSAEFLSSSGYRLKCQLNENAKLHAFHHTIPEMNHNEIIGWESYKEAQFQVKVVNIVDRDYHPQNLKRFSALNEILNEQKIEVITLSSNEDSRKVRIMDLIFLCDWISFYASVLRGFDPSEIDYINRMKQQLS